MPDDPKSPETSKTPDTPPAGSEGQQPDSVTSRLAAHEEAMRILGREGAERVAGGEPIEEVSLDYQNQTGLTAETITKAINDGIASGDGGSAVLSGVRDVMGLMHTENLNREGRREFENLAVDPELSAPFKKYRAPFTRYLKETGVNFVSLSRPGSARRAFRIFLSENDEYQEEVKKKEREAIRKEEEERIRKEMEARTPTKAPTPSLNDHGSRPEGGGVLRRMVDEALVTSEEPTPNQAGVMEGLGFDEEKQKAAMKNYSKKTAMGTPLSFIPTRNEGAVD